MTDEYIPDMPSSQNDIADLLVKKMRAAFDSELPAEESQEAFTDFLIFNGSIHSSKWPGVARRLLAIIQTQDRRIQGDRACDYLPESS